MQWWNGKDECLLACIFIFDCTGTDNFYAFANCRYYALRTSIEHSLCLFYDVHVDSLKFELLTCTDSSSIFLSNSALFVSVHRFQLVCMYVCTCTRWVNKVWSPSTSSIRRRLYIFSKFPFCLSFHFHSLLIPPISNLPYLIGHPSICSVCHHVDIRYSATQCTIVCNIVCERR